MTAFYAALCIIQTIFGIGSRRDHLRNTTDWLKLALAVAARPEEEDSKRLVQVALESNNQEFLDLLRAALNTRVAAAARLADIESDGIECRAFLPGSPALWGWTTNMAAEAAILKAGMESAMSTSVFDSPSASSSSTNEDVFVDLGSSEVMGGATLRDIYAKAWEFHREPLIWTPRGPGAGVGASTWTLTPVSLTSQGAKTRNRSVSDASDSRSSIAAQSPCLQAQRNCLRRDSLHDVFAPLELKNTVKTSPRVEVGVAPLSPSVATPPLASIGSEPPISRRPRRSTSCTRSHISSTTAITVSECSTTQELNGLGLGCSLDRSVWPRPGTPTDSCFGDAELVNENDPKGKRTHSSRAVSDRGLASSAAVFRRNKSSSHSVSIHNPKQARVTRPSMTPLQRPQPSVPKRLGGPQQSVVRTQLHTSGRTSRLNSTVAATSVGPTQPQELSSLRRVRSVATISPSPSPRVAKAGLKTPLVGPVPATRRVSIKQDSTLTESSKLTRTTLPEALNSNHASVAPRQAGITRIPSTSQSQIPRPASRACSISGPARAESPLLTPSLTPRREPQQLPTPTSIVRAEDRASSQFPPPGPTGNMARARSRAGSSAQERPAFVKDMRLSRPSSRAHLVAGPADALKHRSRRSDSIASVSTMADRWETAIEKEALVAA